VIYAIAEALYTNWQRSDKELSTPWEDAPKQLRRVFLRSALTAVEVVVGKEK
jgi:hypothetical protein